MKIMTKQKLQERWFKEKNILDALIVGQKVSSIVVAVSWIAGMENLALLLVIGAVLLAN